MTQIMLTEKKGPTPEQIGAEEDLHDELTEAAKRLYAPFWEQVLEVAEKTGAGHSEVGRRLINALKAEHGK